MATQISIVIPAYNAGPFIAETLRSAMAQTQAAAEIILVDSESTDDTVAIARATCPTLRVVAVARRGAAYARNAGVDAASTPWIAFLDADDVWAADKLQRQWALIEAAPDVDLVFCDAWPFRGDEVLLPHFLETRPRYAALPKRELAQCAYVFECDMAAALMSANYVLTTSMVLLRRQAFLAVGGFDVSLQVCEDFDCWLRLLKGRKAGVVDMPLVGYRHHGNSLSDDPRAMVMGRIAVSERVFANPAAYANGAEIFFRGEKARRQRELGLLDLHAGQLGQARLQFRESLRSAFVWSTLMLYLSTGLGRKGRDLLLRVKRLFSG